MRKQLTCIMTVICLLIGSIPSAFAGGFALYEWSAREISLGGATIANVKDASTLPSNPAGITQIDHRNIVVGGFAISLKTNATTQNDYNPNQTFKNSNDDQFIYVPNIYFSTPMTDKLYFGIGVYSRFGMKVDWGNDWPGRYNLTEGEAKSISTSPTIAYKVLPNLSVALGVELMYVDIELQSAIDATRLFVATGQSASLTAMGLPTTVNDPSTNLLDVRQTTSGDSLAFGYNIGLHYKYSEKVALGLSYTSRVDNDADGEISFAPSTTIQSLLPALRQLVPGLYEKANFESTVTTPDMVFLGIMLKPVQKLSIELSANWVHWAVFDELRFKYDKAAIGVNEVATPKDWENTWRIALGLEYDVNDKLTLRGGLVYDETPISDDHLDYLVPDSDRNMISVGLGYSINDNLQLDLGYLYIMFKDRDIGSRQVSSGVLATSFEDTTSHIIAMNLGYQF